MYHTIEFRVEFTMDLEIPSKNALEQLIVHKGVRVRTEIKPSVAETEEGPMEMADLFFESGTVIRRMPFAYFSFVEE